MSKILKEYHLSNNLKVTIFDETTRYFCNYFNVILELRVPINIDESLFEEKTEFEEVCNLLGKKLIYSKIITKNAVIETELDKVKEMVIKDFEKNSLPYLEKNSFIRKFILKKLKEKKRELEIERLRRELSKSEDASSL
ncbi:MAG: hypothetical protein N2202_08980 [Proteobacteria bacterium]|nr:hypothetical protein [Pseudomonadota bacterium]